MHFRIKLLFDQLPINNSPCIPSVASSTIILSDDVIKGPLSNKEANNELVACGSRHNT